MLQCADNAPMPLWTKVGHMAQKRARMRQCSNADNATRVLQTMHQCAAPAQAHSSRCLFEFFDGCAALPLEPLGPGLGLRIEGGINNSGDGGAGGAREVDLVEAAEAHLAAPPTEVGARVVERVAELDEHLQGNS